MNKTTLHLLFLTGLAAIFCASCSKDKDLQDIPDAYHYNDSIPFSVEAIPPEAYDSITLYRWRKNGDDQQSKRLNYKSMTLLESREIIEGDSLVLTAWPKNGYTFINWVRNGKEVTTKSSYGFKLEKEDIDTTKWHIKHHYEARFGLDYALQVIPPIDSIIPFELIKAMGPYLHFGDNPPRIDTCFISDNIRLARFIHNNDDPSTTYYKQDSTFTNDQLITIRFSGQHRSVADSTLFVHSWGEIIPGNDLSEESKAHDSIFIMGKGNEFTAYYCHTAKKRIEPDEELYAHMITDFYVERTEYFIITGRLTTRGISDCRIGTCVKKYSEQSQNIGEYNGLPAIHDIIIYDFPNDNLQYATSF